MSAEVPAWLSSALKSAPKHAARLTIATLADERSFGRGGFSLSSPAFEHGEELDPCFTADEEDAVAPPLEWNAPPPGAQEIVILVEDADAGGDTPTCHWTVWGLPGQKGMLLEGETPPRVGKNSQRNSEWQLPAPPMDDDAHIYVFQIFALDLPMVLMPGASRAELVKAMEGHVVAAAVLTGTYKREEGDDDLADNWDEDDDG
ncbi:YbhB/YbcL family Raf kinase inhibitor-like protein [Pontixanthobacter aestiaquae]|uniref:YbhB/YbcL family Raf kinase inhibitor-like protein n=1 Tax=Pontixanthobacter aestiaquae TaxID=1509367 RepID=A0A844Z4L5_9SPHN|nr:YbhB/YbcL family Raf kinase inhibitor-like protein [Pontixanthobacter aestiaquae]MDN3646342.1 YbhB/YbcL family Raf kinase inhibitor-like protein [Pontixanthobacter aestiaquae]MXO82668.1 YbhB/YbcL family Raf kinase inhibitor-like protein [Pontixanthobacter aestiaquae]